MRVLGTILVIVGLVFLILGGFTLFIPRDVVDLGFMTVTVWEDVRVPMPPIVGLVSLIVGVILLATAPAYGPPAAPPPREYQ